MPISEFLTHFPDYHIVEKPSSELVAHYQGLVPVELLAIWQLYGFGTFCEGYLKVVNPADYADLLAETYQLTSVAAQASPLVLFATAMGDLIIWEDNYLVLINYRYGQATIVSKEFDFFFQDLIDGETLQTTFFWEPYSTARLKLGEPAYDECFGYVPLLALGGPETATHLEKVKLREHIYLISQFIGVIEQ